MLSTIRLLARLNTIKIIKPFNVKRNFNILTTNFKLQPITLPSIQHNLQIQRQKSKGKSKKSQKEQSSSGTDEDDADKWEEQITDKSTKISLIRVNSLRIDGLLRAGLGIPRNKIETFFYQSKIRLNGDKTAKKSTFAQEGDEIDVIKGPDPKNPNFLNVARVEILSVAGTEDNVRVKIRKCKSLTIENYEEKWMPSA